MNSQLGLCQAGGQTDFELLPTRDLLGGQCHGQPHRELVPPHRQSLVPGITSVLDSCDYRPELSMVPGMGLGCDSANGAYPTLTPLQPLKEKYPPQRLAPSSVIGSFAFLRDDRSLPNLNGLYGPYKDLGMCPGVTSMGSPSLAMPSAQQTLPPYGHVGGEKMLLPPGSFNGHHHHHHPSIFIRGGELTPPSPTGVLPLGALQPPPGAPPGTELAPDCPQPRRSPLAGCQGAGPRQLEEINTREVAQQIMVELKKYSIPQAIFAQRVLCRSQGTLSDLLRNPKPWGKLKSGRETFRRMWNWLQEPEYQRMSTLRLEACRRKEHEQASGDRNHLPKKHRLVFTDVQRRTLLAIFKENPRPNRELQVTIAQQLGLEISTVGNFFMNSRRRSLDKWLVEGGPCSTGSATSTSSSASTYANS
ncbi:one cut domain family member 2-like [Heterodontus francisci]|uniref:one cut domain family member 2-like n=1 Tax=Heterodontus francisci TaxID=7792 RepID=UPI00355B14E1